MAEAEIDGQMRFSSSSSVAAASNGGHAFADTNGGVQKHLCRFQTVDGGCTVGTGAAFGRFLFGFVQHPAWSRDERVVKGVG